MKTKEPIRLRQRKTPAGLISLYLDIYDHGHRSYEYLRLYLIPEKTRDDREKNRETLQLAETIRAKRLVELRNGEYGFKNRHEADRVLFFDYYDSVASRKTGSSASNWSNARNYLRAYERNTRVTFADITRRWVQGFKDYLDKNTSLRENSKLVYYSKLRACINQALKEGIITRSPCAGIEAPQAEEGTRMYLTIDELQRLAATPCRDEIIKRIFLFSCLTGLRKSDIEALTWRDVQQQGDFTRIFFRQQKTREREYLDITPQARELMGEQKAGDIRIFPGIPHTATINYMVRRWVKAAGINKYLSFHCARHTFATMMLDLDTDIYTVSKLLGHRNIGTTQIYAHMLDKNKQAAVASIPRLPLAEHIPVTDQEPARRDAEVPDEIDKPI